MANGEFQQSVIRRRKDLEASPCNSPVLRETREQSHASLIPFDLSKDIEVYVSLDELYRRLIQTHDSIEWEDLGIKAPQRLTSTP
ncbi:Hypothetical predicted protein [Octopus vulgaris]|uniref:Uncharacterized protein n=1 Tax=Octopus vulgaris TaxID=6645 RepID=A0AA36EYV9_OCTVU|nr:Hypothetical predicted protein [Octopus vulgaris]